MHGLLQYHINSLPQTWVFNLSVVPQKHSLCHHTLLKRNLQWLYSQEPLGYLLLRLVLLLVDVQTTPSIIQQFLPKLCILAKKLFHSTTPTTTTPTVTWAPSPTRSESSNKQSPQITSPLDTNFLKIEVHEALNSLRHQRLGPSNTQSTGVLEANITSSEKSESDIKIFDNAKVQQP